MSCSEQICTVMGSETWQIFSSLFSSRLGSASFSSVGSPRTFSKIKFRHAYFMFDNLYDDMGMDLNSNLDDHIRKQSRHGFLALANMLTNYQAYAYSYHTT